MDEIKHESVQVQMPLPFTFDYGRVSINAIIHDELNCLILTCHIFNFHVLDSE